MAASIFNQALTSSLRKRQIRVLDSHEDRNEFMQAFAGKRVLHVKGFGTSFQTPTPEQKKLFERQIRDSMAVIGSFRPDYIVADGDPWGGGFQRYISSYMRKMEKTQGNMPEFIWVKNCDMDREGRNSVLEDLRKRKAQAQEWCDKGDMDVTVFWIDNKKVADKVGLIFGGEVVEELAGKDALQRGAVTIGEAHWVAAAEAKLQEAIQAIENRVDQRGFEKCAFENSAKGHAIFDLLHRPELAAHGAVSFGGGESVLLEFGTRYLNSMSGFNSDYATMFPCQRGRTTDPALPRFIGKDFCLPLGKTLDELFDELVTAEADREKREDGRGAGGQPAGMLTKEQYKVAQPKIKEWQNERRRLVSTLGSACL